jgi:hypothetical protein
MEAVQSSTNAYPEWDRGLGRSSSTELEGAIPQLCSSMATVRVSLAYAPLTRKDAEEKKLNIKQLYLDMSHVVHLAYEVLDNDIVKAYSSWIHKKVINPYESDNHAKEALDICTRLQADLYMKGYKDTNRSESLPFPMECYLSE